MRRGVCVDIIRMKSAVGYFFPQSQPPPQPGFLPGFAAFHKNTASVKPTIPSAIMVCKSVFIFSLVLEDGHLGKR